MDLTNQTQIVIQNKVFTLGSPVTHADTLDQLLHAFQEMGVTERPIVIINPVGDSLPDLSNLLENYIENAMQGQLIRHQSSYMFQDASDDDIRKWAESQYTPDGVQSLESLFQTGLAIREQSRLKSQLDRAKSKQEALWKQHCLHPESNEGSAEYADITYNQIPQIEQAIQQVTIKMSNIPKDLGSPTHQQTSVENYVEAVENRVENHVEAVENITESSLEMVGTGNPDIQMFSTTNQLMPLSVAKQLAQNPQNSVFREQQSKSVPGYATVPLEYLIALGIPLYADGVPVVYTKSGRFRRIGDSDISPIVQSYWYPTPRYM